MTAYKQCLYQVTTDESGAARNNTLHSAVPLRVSLLLFHTACLFAKRHLAGDISVIAVLLERTVTALVTNWTQQRPPRQQQIPFSARGSIALTGFVPTKVAAMSQGPRRANASSRSPSISI